jgi:hypothetical protein
MNRFHFHKELKLGWITMLLFISILSIVTLGQSLHQSALAQQPEDTLLYREDFNDNFGQGWNWPAEGWELKTLDDNNLILAGDTSDDDTHYFAEYNAGDWGRERFKLKFKFLINYGGFYTRFLTRSSSSGQDFYDISIVPDQTNPSNPTLRVQLIKYINGQWGEWIRSDVQEDFYLDRWYQVVIYYDAGKIQVYVGKGKILDFLESPHVFIFPDLEYTDPNPLSSGSIEFETEANSSFYIDDIEVWGPVPPPSTFMMMGNVFSSPPGDLSEPLVGVEVSAFISNNPYPDLGKQMAVSKTDENGRFWFEVPAGYEYYSIREVNSSGYISVLAESPGGVVYDNDWIEFSAPLDGKNLDGNRFFDRIPAREISAEPFPPFGECPPGNELLFINDFDQSLPDGWHIDSGWNLHDSWLVGEGNNQWAYYDAIWDDVDVNMVFSLQESRQGMGIVLRYSSSGDYWLVINPRGLSLQRGQGNNTPEIIINNPMDLDTSIRHTVVFSARGDRVRVVLDGWPQLDWSDANPMPPGTFHLNTMQEGSVSIDKLWVCGFPVELPPTEIPPTTELTPTEIPPTVVTPTEAIVGSVITPTHPPNSGGIEGVILVIAGMTFLAFLTLLIFWAAKGGGGNRGAPQEPAQPAGPPPLPPVRLARLWLSQGSSETGARLGDNQPLTVGGLYTLHLQLTAREAASPVAPSGEAALLDVVFYAPGDQVSLEEPASQVQLPAFGSSPEIRCAIRPLQEGSSQVRACIYYRNVLLQSVTLNAEVIAHGGRPVASGPAISCQVDYIAAARFHRLDQLPHPSLSIFVNQATGGSHWVGVYSGNKTAPRWLRQGDLHTFTKENMISLSKRMRNQMVDVEGEAIYRMGYALPMDASTLEKRARDLVKLAIEGAYLFDELFTSSCDGLPEERWLGLLEVLKNPGVITVARCQKDSESLPWAAVYILPLDVDRPKKITLCADFQNQLAAEVWDVNRNLQTTTDLMDNPLSCRNRSKCPLNGEDKDLVVCPFGFLGFMHQIDQPLQQVTPVSVDVVPPELQTHEFEQSCQIWLAKGDTIHLAMGAYPGFNDAQAHFQELEGLMPGGGLDALYETDRNQVRKIIEQGGRHVFYLYCHGVVEENVFMLRLGTSEGTSTISAASLDPTKFHRPDQPRTLFVLNACESVVYDPQLIYGFLGKLPRLGATGVVGSEVKLYTGFARPFGLQLMRELLSGNSLGEAFLDIRRHFLRQGNPLGLIYTMYAPANLHLHREIECGYCQRHPAHEDRLN